MSPFWLAVIGLWCSALIVLTGCGPAISTAPTTSDDIYLAVPHTVPESPPLSLTIINQLTGGITIFTARLKEVAADAIVTGTGTTLADTLDNETACVDLTNTGAEINVALVQGKTAKECSVQTQLHVRVPPGANLARVSASKGDVEVLGNVGNVTAGIASNGNIKVLGASGDINLATGNGSVTAQLAPGETNNLTVQTQGGNVNLMAVTTLVTAATQNGNIRFIGTLRSGSSRLTITGTGNLDLGMPAYTEALYTQPYRVFAATSAGPIIADYPPTVTVNNQPTALTICGFIDSVGPYDYHIETRPNLRFGRIEVSSDVTGTFFFTGTLGSNYYRFETNRSKISLYAPFAQGIHIYTPAQIVQFKSNPAAIDQDCKDALNPASPPVTLNLSVGRGRIYIRHIFMKK